MLHQREQYPGSGYKGGRGKEGVMREIRPRNDGVEEEDEGDSVTHKERRREGVSPLTHLIRSCPEMPHREDPHK